MSQLPGSATGDDVLATNQPIPVTLAWFWMYAALAGALALGLGHSVALMAQTAIPPAPTRLAVTLAVMLAAGVGCERVLNSIARYTHRY